MISTETLSQFNLFSGLPESMLREIAAMSRQASYKKDEFVFREGETADKLHFLLHGSVALRVNLTSRPESVTVSFISMPYQIFGWSGMVAPNHYTSSAQCDEDSELLIVPAEPFMKLLASQPEHGFHVMLRIAEIISDRLRNSRQALLKTL
ncbi:MAG: cyclic nucleotide-binding domain-containing protein [Chloroflexi bacterium]|nr:cyclic nucleotide-binding domain-containing protein [Chloroflexota bacterium]